MCTGIFATDSPPAAGTAGRRADRRSAGIPAAARSRDRRARRRLTAWLLLAMKPPETRTVIGPSGPVNAPDVGSPAPMSCTRHFVRRRGPPASMARRGARDRSARPPPPGQVCPTRRATSETSAMSPDRTARSSRSSIMSESWSRRPVRSGSPGWRAGQHRQTRRKKPRTGHRVRPARTRPARLPALPPQRRLHLVGVLHQVPGMGSSAWPSSVRLSRRVVRWNKRTPKCCSNCAICLVTADWLAWVSRATAENEPVSTTRTKAPSAPAGP